MASKNFPSFHRRVSIPSLPIPIGMMGVRRSPGSVILVSLTLFCGVVFLLLRSGIGTALGPAWLSFLVYDDGYPRHNAEYATYVPRVGDPELQWRLRRLLDAPLQDYKTALVANEAPGACPRDIADRQAIRDQLRGQGSWWKTVRSSELAKRRMAMVKYLENIALSGGDVIGRPGGGRGIVMTGGNKDTTQRLLVTLRILRFEHRCKLPVEVFAFPGEIDDQDILFQMRALDATVRELPRQKLKKWKNFQIKADAIIASSFEEVLYLDSDNIPLRDPTYLFDSELYAGKGQPGAVFWPDITKDHGTNTIWRLMGKTCYHDDWELETGQIVISKTGNRGLNLAALHIAAHMQFEHPFYFRLSDGDKDTFRYAFWALGGYSDNDVAMKEGTGWQVEYPGANSGSGGWGNEREGDGRLRYSTAPWWLSTLGFHDDWEQGRFCGISMVQHDIGGPVHPNAPANAKYSTLPPTPLFLHLNLLKHRTRTNKLSLPSVPASSSSSSNSLPLPLPPSLSPLQPISLSTGSPFTIIKRAADISAQALSLKTGAARFWVYGNEGPCLDVSVRQDVLAEGLEALAPGNRTWEEQKEWKQHVIEERFAEVAGGAFAEFDRMYRGQGGRDGGWESSTDKL